MSRPGQRWSRRRARALLRHSGPTSLLFRRRLALIGGAVLVGLAALAFAWAADEATEAFHRLATANRWLPLLLTPSALPPSPGSPAASRPLPADRASRR